MLNGLALGTSIANAVTDPQASPEARAAVLSQWINIGNALVSYLTSNATITTNPLLIPVSGPPSPDGAGVLAGASGPVSGVVNISPIKSTLI